MSNLVHINMRMSARNILFVTLLTKIAEINWIINNSLSTLNHLCHCLSGHT